MIPSRVPKWYCAALLFPCPAPALISRIETPSAPCSAISRSARVEQESFGLGGVLGHERLLSPWGNGSLRERHTLVDAF